MDYATGFIVSNSKEESISIQRVNDELWLQMAMKMENLKIFWWLRLPKFFKLIWLFE